MQFIRKTSDIEKAMRAGKFPGFSYPLGAAVYPSGVNFCVFSAHGHKVELLLFDDAEAEKPSRVIPFDPVLNKTANYWHIFVPGLGNGQIYAFRVHGPYEPGRGLRYDGKKVLLDPYARAVVVSNKYEREAAIRPGDNCSHALKSVVVDTSVYDWQNDAPLRHPRETTIIYEMHLAGFTRNPNSGVSPQKRGTYAGLVEKIPYLKDLGITAVELLPVQQFDEQDAPEGLVNYWGYSPLAFFAPHSAYSSRRDALGPVDEFRDMVKALHAAGIEVILDVVFNHTAEGNHEGPTFSFRGFEDRAYYILDSKGMYLNYTGCGNTVNANHSVTRRLIMECLRYWVTEMHVDGFRFDLASVLSRDENGVPLLSPPILWDIDSDPVLAGTKIIAEAWDAAGLYQVGTFAGDRFCEWNGRFRDDVRRFVKGDNGMAQSCADRIAGSPDIYRRKGRHPTRSVNFLTCHDGFTMYDLVSYNTKHNETNALHNTDGMNENFSWNCGVEGPTDRAEIAHLRRRQMKNFFTLLLMSQGIPMILMGDEVCRTQRGNNNAFCQDNEISWFDWELAKHNHDMARFVKMLIRFTQRCSFFSQKRYLDPPGGAGAPAILWHGVRLMEPDFSYLSHSLAFQLCHPARAEFVHVMLNAWWEALTFELPPLPAGMAWCRIADTFLEPPDDICDMKTAPVIQEKTYRLQPRSTVILAAQAHVSGRASR
mgnify:CR=1 FL=1